MVNDQSLQLQMKAFKENIPVGEPVEVELRLINKSKGPYVVNQRMAINPGKMVEGKWEVKFDVTFPPGKRLIRGAKIRREELKKEDFRTLSPGELISKTYILTRYYWMELAGTYTVIATYHNGVNGSQFGLSAWTGEIISNSISFRVTQ